MPSIDTPGVIRLVSDLFAGYPDLIRRFDVFNPPGYHVECEPENKLDSILITTPSGTTIHDTSAARALEPPPKRTRKR